MRIEHLPGKTLFASILCISVGGFGCSDDGSTADNESSTSDGGPTSGSPGPTTSGAQASTSAVTTGAGMSQTTTGSTTTGGPFGGTSSSASSSNSGSSSGTGGAGMGGAGTTDTTTGAPNTTGTDTASADTTGSSTTGPGTTGSDTTSTTGGDLPGPCTESQGAGVNASGTGPYDVVIETNSDDGIRCGTIFRPATLGGEEKFPIFVWGEGGCSQNGLSNQAAMAEIASWGYFIVADGTPGSTNACQGRQNGEAFLDYISWAIDENSKPCSAYYHSLDTTKIAADGFSCGGLMAENVAGDPRFTAIGITSSGLMGPNNALWDSMHAPFKIMNGGSSDIAYQNGLNDYEAIASRGIPILYFSKTSAGHGGDLGQGRGDFNLVNLAWLNWQLKGDEGATGKAFLIGSSCEFCNDGGWEFMSANIE